jgi:DGQHR domain-containing protein
MYHSKKYFMSNIESTSFQCLQTQFGTIPAYTFTMKVKDILPMHYVAVRGVDREDGSVQRVLNKRRIADIKEYILDGNTFFNSFILNWTDKNYTPEISNNMITIPKIPSSAQAIDGQHRLAGLEEAMKSDPLIGEHDVIVTLCIRLNTPQAAKIFLNINAEQKPVPKSLIYDLFGEMIDDETHAVNRATDIARELNDDPESPLYKLIKFPGSPRGLGSIELSTFVAAFKEHLKPNGTFHLYKLKAFDQQKGSIYNYFYSIRKFYSDAKLWDVKAQNPFLKAAGFNGAVDFFVGSLLHRCAEKGSFSVKTISSLIALDKEGIITWDDLKGLDGKTSRKKVKDKLESNLLNSLPDQEEYEF